MRPRLPDRLLPEKFRPRARSPACACSTISSFAPAAGYRARVALNWNEQSPCSRNGSAAEPREAAAKSESSWRHRNRAVSNAARHRHHARCARHGACGCARAELPGKVCLPKEAYVIVQQIYYPGFTIAGFGEFAALSPRRSCFGPLPAAPWLSGLHLAESLPRRVSIGLRFTRSISFGYREKV
jgi:hypothetical protein